MKYILTERETKRLRANKHSAEIIGARYLQTELDLFKTKWFDYSFLSVDEANDAFTIDYQECYRMIFRKNFDAAEALRKKGLMQSSKYSHPLTPDEKANIKREKTQVWIGRQCLDALGIPYKKGILWAMEAHMRDGYRNVPRPNQLLTGPRAEATIKFVVEKWDDWRNSTKLYSTLPHYRNENFCDLPAQIRHREWVLAELRAGHPHAIGRACYIDRVLPESVPLAKWGEDRVERARQAIATETPVDEIILPRDYMRQACFGLPFAFNPCDQTCAACPDNRLCSQADQGLRNKLAAAYGCEDPRVAERRAQDCERQRRHRMKKAALKAAAKGGTPTNVPSKTTAPS